MLLAFNDFTTLQQSAEAAVTCYNMLLMQHTLAKLGSYSSKKERMVMHKCDVSFSCMPLIWDTGASQGLTPFLSNFTHYQPAHIPVKDISKTSYVTGIDTVMYKFQATNGNNVYLSMVAFHLPSAKIRLLSPQSYHQ